MESVLLAALLAAAPVPAPADAPAVDLDRRCFALMAELAEAEDSRLRSLGQVAAQYFLGRIDAASADFDPEALPAVAAGDRETLLRRCGDAMQAGGRDFRSIGEALVPARRPAA